MSTTQRTIRRTETDDAEAIVELMSRIHGVRHEPEYWSWKYDQNPAGRSVSVVVEEEGTLVGHVGGILTRFAVHGDLKVGAQELDIFIDPEYRKAGTFFHMLAFRKRIHDDEPIDFSYGFANDVTSKVSERSPAEYRYRKVASLPRSHKLLDPTPYLQQRVPVGWLAAPIGAAARWAYRAVDRKRATVPLGMQLARLSRFDQRFDSLWTRIKDDYPIMIWRDAEYLNWRYCDCPTVEHDVFCLEKTDGSEVLGYVVLGVRRKEIARGVILDVVTPRDDDGAIARVLIDHALRWFRQRRLAVAVCWMYPHCHIYPQLKEFGFHVRPKIGNNLMYRGLTDFIEEQEAHSEETWFISMGDSDF